METLHKMPNVVGLGFGNDPFVADDYQLRLIASIGWA